MRIPLLTNSAQIQQKHFDSTPFIPFLASRRHCCCFNTFFRRSTYYLSSISMYPSKQDTAHEMNQKPSPPLPPPVTGYPVGPFTNQHHNEVHSHPIQHQQQQQPGRWSSGLCDCFSDIPNCCITCWCPCITFGRIAEIVDKGTTPCAVSGAIYGVLLWFTGCPCIYSCIYRTKMRKQLMFEDRPCNDCLVHFCCDACALCQEYRELKHRGFDMTMGWQENVERQNGGVTMIASAPTVEQGMKR